MLLLLLRKQWRNRETLSVVHTGVCVAVVVVVADEIRVITRGSQQRAPSSRVGMGITCGFHWTRGVGGVVRRIFVSNASRRWHVVGVAVVIVTVVARHVLDCSRCKW